MYFVRVAVLYRLMRNKFQYRMNMMCISLGLRVIKKKKNMREINVYSVYICIPSMQFMRSIIQLLRMASDASILNNLMERALNPYYDVYVCTMDLK